MVHKQKGNFLNDKQKIVNEVAKSVYEITSKKDFKKRKKHN